MLEQACKHLELNPETYFKSEQTYMQKKELVEKFCELDLKVKRDLQEMQPKSLMTEQQCVQYGYTIIKL